MKPVRDDSDVTSAAWVPDPLWGAGMPGGLVPPATGDPVFSLVLQTAPVLDVGKTHLGRRRVIPTRGGRITGPRLAGTVEPGGLGFELTLDNGVVEAEQVHVLRTDSGEPVYLRACGLSPRPDVPARFVPHFDARSDGPAAWLNDAPLVAVRTPGGSDGEVSLAFHTVDAAAQAGLARLSCPRADGTGARWDAAKAVGQVGPLRFSEDVGIGRPIQVGATPRGARTIIPITGGTFEGHGLAGEVLPYGADYQLARDGNLALDARYVLRDRDGELIVVRNCGSLQQLVPAFEARAEGPHAHLNGTPFFSRVELNNGRVTVFIHAAS